MSVSQRRAFEMSRAYGVNAQNVFGHNMLNLSLTALIVLLYSLASTYALHFELGWNTLVLASIFGWLHFCVFALVVHEASHGQYLIGALSKLNDVIGSAACALFGVDYATEWILGHRLHHQNPVHKHDPQNCTAPTGKRFIVLFAKVLLIPGYANGKILRQQSTAGIFNCTPMVKPKWANLLPLALLMLFVAYLCKAQSNWNLLAIVLISYQVSSAFNVLKVALEHGGEFSENTPIWLKSRSTTNLFVRTLMPFNITVHFEHHLNPNVPWYRLVDLNSELREVLPSDVKAKVFNT